MKHRKYGKTLGFPRNVYSDSGMRTIGGVLRYMAMKGHADHVVNYIMILDRTEDASKMTVLLIVKT